MSTADRMSARQRARAARIEMSKKRAEKDRMIESAAESFFKAEESAEQARAQLAECDADRAAAVQELDKLGITASDMAEMLDLDVKEVRSLRRVKLDNDLKQDELPSDDESSEADGVAAVAVTTKISGSAN